MSQPPLDDFLLGHAPGPLTPLAPALEQARAGLRKALDDLWAIDDTALDKPWPWRGGEEASVRYGLYRQLEALEEAAAANRPLLAEMRGPEPPARPILGTATAARWDLQGLLGGLTEEVLDRDPGDEQWTVRQTLSHIIGGQRGYGWGTAWWLSRRDAPVDDFPQWVPDEVFAGIPSEDSEAEGSIADISRRLDTVLDQTAGLFAALDEPDLAVRARWSGVAVDVRFRLHRWSSHIREHTVQVEKTLVMLGSPLGEVERVVRLIAVAYGRLEEDLYMWPAEDAAIDRAAQQAVAAAAQMAELAGGVREAAETGR